MRAVALSDLHLDATAGTATDEAFVSLLEWLAERADADAEPLPLILLDLLHAPAGVHDPLAALDAVAAASARSMAPAFGLLRAGR